MKTIEKILVVIMVVIGASAMLCILNSCDRRKQNYNKNMAYNQKNIEFYAFDYSCIDSLTETKGTYYMYYDNPDQSLTIKIKLDRCAYDKCLGIIGLGIYPEVPMKEESYGWSISYDKLKKTYKLETEL